MNTTSLIGRLTRDPDVQATPSGLSVARFGFAVDGASAKKGDDGRYGAGFFDVVAFGKAADTAAGFKKGKQLGVTGHLSWSSWEEKDTGRKRTKVEIVADRFTFVGPRDDQPSGAFVAPTVAEDDIPF